MSLPDAFEIIKKRWPEVVLIVFLYAGVMMLMEQVSVAAKQNEAAGNDASQPPTMIAFLLGTMAIAIIAQMLYLGFLKTACTDGTAPREPGVLLRIGRHYFWRIMRFQLIIIFGAYLVLAGLILSLLAPFFPEATKPEDLPKWVQGISSLLPLIVLIKPLILSPALMVGCDMMAVKSIVSIRMHRIFGERKVLALYVLGYIIISAILIAFNTFKISGALRYFRAGFCGGVISMAMLALHLEALRMVTFGLAPATAEQDTGADDDQAIDEQP